MTLGAQVKIDFQGSSIAVYGEWYIGGFLASLDSGPPIAVYSEGTLSDFNSSAVVHLPIELLCTFDSLEEGVHTLVLTNSGAGVNAFNGLDSLHVDFANVTTTDPTNLNGLVGTNDTVSSSSVSTSLGATQTPQSTVNSAVSSSHIGAVAGGIAGGAFACLILVITLFIYRRRHRKRMNIDLFEKPESPASEQVPPNASYEPYVYNPHDHSSLGSSLKDIPSHDQLTGLGSSTPATVAVTEDPPDSPIGVTMAHDQPGARRKPILPSEPIQGTIAPNADRERPPTPPPLTSVIRQFAEDACVSLLRGHTGEDSILPPQYNPAWNFAPLPFPDDHTQT